jgi:hypothetical protein
MAAGYASSFTSPFDTENLFPSPWRSDASPAIPENYRHALDLCEFLFLANGAYAELQRRLIAYFLTDIDVQAPDNDHELGDDERNTWNTFLTDVVELKTALFQLNLDKACYGNAFASLWLPFRRLLTSTGGSRLTLALEEMARNPGKFSLAYDAANCKFMADDPVTNQRCEWRVTDVLKDEVRVKVWNPKEIEIICDPYTDQRQYLWRIPADYKQEIRRGNMHYLACAPLEVLKAIRGDQLFMFDKDALFHAREQTLSGVKMRGWGLSRVLVNYRDIRYAQILRRQNEAIALDYVMPFRVITPEVRARGGVGATPDPLLTVNMGDFRSNVLEMIRARRSNPTAWHALPYPISYQALGGDANQLAPHELTAQALDMMLNSGGGAAEFYRGTLQIQAAPVALRLMESAHHNLVHDNNRFLRWFVSRATRLVSLPAARLQMQRVTHADDFNRVMLAMQLFMGQQLSGQTALKFLGLNWLDENRQMTEEEAKRQQLRNRLQEELQQADMGSQIAKGQVGPQPGQPGQPPQAGAQPGVAQTGAMGIGSPVSAYLSTASDTMTPQELIAQAESLAADLSVLPETQRLSELRQLKQKHEALHAMTKVKLDELRQRQRSAGGAMLAGQQPAMAA